MKQKINIFIIALFLYGCSSSQHTSAGSSLSSTDEESIADPQMDSLKVSLCIHFRRDVTSYHCFHGLSSQDTVIYKSIPDTILGRVRMFTIEIDKTKSLGAYKESHIKELKLEFKDENNKILGKGFESMYAPIQKMTSWNGGGSPEALPEADHVTIYVTTQLGLGKKNKIMEFVVKF